MAEFSFWTYALACVGNWSTHSLWIADHLWHLNVSVPMALYCLMLTSVVQVSVYIC